MKIQLAKDFEIDESPVKLFKDRIKQEEKERHHKRFSLRSNTRQVIEVIDPLNQELEEYKQSIEKAKVIPKSKAYLKMKRYISEQERKLKHVRLQQINQNQRSLKTQSFIQDQEQQPQQFATAIPQMDQFFKNQIMQSLIYENKLLNKSLEKRVYSLQDTMRVLNLSKTQSRGLKSIKEEQMDIDTRILFNKERNKKLILKLSEQKKGIIQHTVTKSTQSIQSAESTIMVPSKSKTASKTRIKLQKLKSVQIKFQNKIRNVSPSISLLLQLRNLKDLKQKKESQLDCLLKSEHQNRLSNISDKNNYYSQLVQFSTMNPSAQFRLRKVMNQKLLHRLKVSKDQTSNFNDFLVQLKESRAVVCECLQQIFQTLRETLLNGKVLRESDFNQILGVHKNREQLKQPVNVSILKKVRNLLV